MNTQKYFLEFKKGVDEVYRVVNEARAKGLDPAIKVEIPLAMSMAEKVVGLISTIYPQMEESGIAERILDLEKEFGKLDPTVTFKIAEEVSKQKFCKFGNVLEAMDAGIRVGFAYTTLAVVSSPIEGYTGLEVDKRRDGKEYIRANFSGPIRSAGTTASCVVLILIDFIRELFGYDKYDPTEEEVKRYVSELTDYHERITNLQYMPTEDEIIFLARNLPIQIAGEKSERFEVSNYKNLPRVNTNYLRSGVCLIFGEGLAQKAAKGFRLLNRVKQSGIISTGFDFLPEYIKLHEKRDKGKTEDSPTYIKDLVAGRPVFGHPGRSGGFRFRYGLGRTSGFSATSVHPATMAITDSFIAIGTQLKIEKPTKGCAVTSCDSIDGPIVKLFNGSVKKLTSKDEAKKIYNDVEEIIYLGDMLFPFGDVANRNAKLIRPGYVEEWWYLELKKNSGKFENFDYYPVSFEDAIKLGAEFKIPLHPSHIFYWSQISSEEFSALIDWLERAKFENKLIFPYTRLEQEKFSKAKRALELLGVVHDVATENVITDLSTSKALLFNLGINADGLSSGILKEQIDFSLLKKEGTVLEIVNSVCKLEIRDKAGEFIGARMGRPEKAKLRKLIGSPNVLFAVGSEGGRLRSVQAAYSERKIRSSFPLYFCDTCDRETIYPSCEVCKNKTRRMFYSYDTKEKSFTKKTEDGKESFPYCTRDLDIVHYFDSAVATLGLLKEEIPVLVKGVRGVSSSEKMMENLAKGILRAKNNLQVNKDGTIRYDVTEIPLISFKPREIKVSVEKLKELGYTEDIYGVALTNENQILELMPHDVLLPSCVDSPDEKADDVFIRITHFVDEELKKFYGLNAFHNVKNKDDLVGQYGVCMAPHNCAGVICRFIGFSNTLGLLASPYMHAAIRRDCDGDEAAIMLLSDVLLNFSRKYLPSHRGGTQDAPLVLNAKIDAGEVDDQILDFEVVSEYPLELYESAMQGKHSSEVKIRMVRDVLREGKDPFVGAGFTHDTNNFNDGVLCSSYKTLATMKDKLWHQMGLVEKLRSADTTDTARLVIERHFLKDMKGNLRNFSIQNFRCVSCNEIFRRPPLKGVCSFCKGKLIFTVHEGGIRKYLDPALELAKKYDLSLYLKQNLELVSNYIDSIFGKDPEKQEALAKWF